MSFSYCNKQTRNNTYGDSNLSTKSTEKIYLFWILLFIAKHSSMFVNSTAFVVSCKVSEPLVSNIVAFRYVKYWCCCYLINSLIISHVSFVSLFIALNFHPFEELSNPKIKRNYRKALHSRLFGYFSLQWYCKNYFEYTL